MAIINDGKTDLTISQVEIEVIGAAVPSRSKTAARRRAGSCRGDRCEAAEALECSGCSRSSSAARHCCQGSTLVGEDRTEARPSAVVTQVVLAFGGNREASASTRSDTSGHQRSDVVISTKLRVRRSRCRWKGVVRRQPDLRCTPTIGGRCPEEVAARLHAHRREGLPFRRRHALRHYCGYGQPGAGRGRRPGRHSARRGTGKTGYRVQRAGESLETERANASSEDRTSSWCAAHAASSESHHHPGTVRSTRYTRT